MSATLSRGLVGVSIQTALVRPGMMAAATASGSVTGALEQSTPQGPSTLVTSR